MEGKEGNSLASNVVLLIKNENKAEPEAKQQRSCLKCRKRKGKIHKLGEDRGELILVVIAFCFYLSSHRLSRRERQWKMLAKTLEGEMAFVSLFA